jgi:hypothetical protein
VLGIFTSQDFISYKGGYMSVLIFSPNGTTTTKTTLAAAVASADVSGKTIVVTSAQTIDDLTIPSTIALRCEHGGIITVNSGKLLTINGSFTAGQYQCFAGSGDVRFGAGSVPDIYPRWFGAKGDGVTADGVAFQRAAFSVYSSGATLRPGNGTFLISPAVTITHPIKVNGEGRNGGTTFLSPLRAAPNGKQSSSNLFTATGINGIEFRDIKLDGGKSAPLYDTDEATNQALIEIIGGTNIILENLQFTRYFQSSTAISSYDDTTYKAAPTYIYNSSNILLKNILYDSTAYGELMNNINVQNLTIDGVISASSAAFTPVQAWGKTTENVKIINCTMKNHLGSAVNLGGKGRFYLAGNTVENGKGFDLSEENSWAQYTDHPSMDGVVITGNNFVDVSLVALVGDTRQVGTTVTGLTTHSVSITGNTVRATIDAKVAQWGLFTFDNAVFSGNSGNASLVAGWYDHLSVTDNIFDMFVSSSTNKTAIICRSRNQAHSISTKIMNNSIIGVPNGGYAFVYDVFTGGIAATNDQIEFSGNTLLNIYGPNYIMVGSGTYLAFRFLSAYNTLSGVPWAGTDGTDAVIKTTSYYHYS